MTNAIFPHKCLKINSVLVNWVPLSDTSTFGMPCVANSVRKCSIVTSIDYLGIYPFRISVSGYEDHLLLDGSSIINMYSGPCSLWPFSRMEWCLSWIVLLQLTTGQDFTLLSNSWPPNKAMCQALHPGNSWMTLM